MMTMTLLRGTALALATLAASVVGNDALAGSCRSSRSSHGSHHGGHVSVSYHGSHGSVSVHSGRHHRSSHQGHVTQRRSYSSSSCDNRGYVSTSTHSSHSSHDRGYVSHRSSGYWQRVWVAPVYRTHYDECGYPYRVQVQAGYHRRVWVSNSRSGY